VTPTVLLLGRQGQALAERLATARRALAAHKRA